MPVAENLQQFRLRVRGDILLGQLARHPDSLLHLFKISHAAGTLRDVNLKARAGAVGEGATAALMIREYLKKM